MHSESKALVALHAVYDYVEYAISVQYFLSIKMKVKIYWPFDLFCQI